jgi:nanoRNase/pAp phosphatase (c-di-AMP/oligoRNAs hydrolase)
LTRYDIFNGDADGLCALHQWRLAHPQATTLVTGVKRDINLLRDVKLGAGDAAHVFDISFDSNRADALRLLESGARLVWFDHHFAGEPVGHPALEAHIDTSADTCTSLIVDSVLGGRYRAWARRVIGVMANRLPTEEMGRFLETFAGFFAARR